MPTTGCTRKSSPGILRAWTVFRVPAFGTSADPSPFLRKSPNVLANDHKADKNLIKPNKIYALDPLPLRPRFLLTNFSRYFFCRQALEQYFASARMFPPGPTWNHIPHAAHVR